MWSVYITIVFVFLWIGLASREPLHKTDLYPFPFLLFLGNLVQLVLAFVIFVGQGVLGRSSDHRSERNSKNAGTILNEVLTLHSYPVKQDQILNGGVDLIKLEAHPRLKERETLIPTTFKAQYVDQNGRIAAAITKAACTMWGFYFAVLFQFGWIGLALAGQVPSGPSRPTSMQKQSFMIAEDVSATSLNKTKRSSLSATTSSQKPRRTTRFDEYCPPSHSKKQSRSERYAA